MYKKISYELKCIKKTSSIYSSFCLREKGHILSLEEKIYVYSKLKNNDMDQKSARFIIFLFVAVHFQTKKRLMILYFC